MVRLLGGAMLLMAAAAEECKDCEASMAVQLINRKRQQKASDPTTQLLQAATKMLREGSTPAVLTFTKETFTEIEKEIFPKIIANHKFDQKMLDDQLDELNTIVKNYKKELLTLAANENVEDNAAETHETCRGVFTADPSGEYELCLDASKKNWKRAQKWKILLTAEKVYIKLAETLHGRFCPPDGTTWHSKNLHEDDINPMVPGLWEYRRVTKDIMIRFNVKGDYYFRTTIIEWMESDKVAMKANASHLVKRTECNSKKKVLEQKSCARAQHHAQIIDTFETEFTAAEITLNKTKDNIAVSEKDRIREFVTLKVVQCLLKKIEERNSTKCDEETDEADEIIKNCETTDVITIHLEIDYPCAPPRPCHDPVKCYPGTPICYRKEHFRSIEDFGFCFSDEKQDEVHNSFPMPAIHNQDCAIIDVSKYISKDCDNTEPVVCPTPMCTARVLDCQVVTVEDMPGHPGCPGCPECLGYHVVVGNVKGYGAQMPSQCVPAGHAVSYDLKPVAVTCCKDGKGSRPDCKHTKTYAEAQDHCESKGLELCSKDEIEAGLGQGSGCGFDAYHNWVTDQCSVQETPCPQIKCAAVHPDCTVTRTSDLDGATGCLGCPVCIDSKQNKHSQVYGNFRAYGSQKPTRCMAASHDGGAVTCCDALGKGSRPENSVGTLAEAKAACKKHGLQLCSRNQIEAGVGQGTGHGFDGKFNWVEDACFE